MRTVETVERRSELLPRIAPGQHHLALLDILGADLQTERHAAHLPLGELPSWRVRLPCIEEDANAGAAQIGLDGFRLRQDGLLPVAPLDGNDDHLVREYVTEPSTGHTHLSSAWTDTILRRRWRFTCKIFRRVLPQGPGKERSRL